MTKDNLRRLYLSGKRPEPPPNQDTEVDEILQRYRYFIKPDITRPPSEAIEGTLSKREAIAALNQYYKSILLEVIGAPEDLQPIDSHTNSWLRAAAERNKLRQEQRQRLESRLGK